MVVANIRITPELAHQLSKENGVPDGDPPRTSSAPGAVFGHRQHESQTKAAARKSKELQSALITSESIGGLLLKNESNEVNKIQSRASALLASDDCQDERQPPCSHERVSVLDCYKENSGNELVCASLVSAYQQCSRSRFQSQVQQ